VALGFPWPDRLVSTARQAVSELLAHSGETQGVLRITWTRGTGARGFAPPDDASPTVTVHLFPLPEDLPRRRSGVRAITAAGLSPGSLAGHKTTSAMVYVEAARRAREAGVEEALLEDGRGGICEATSSNLFAVIERVLVTPPLTLPVLPGITRAWVLANVTPHLLDDSGNGQVESASIRAVEERPLSIADCAAAREVFLTNSVAGVVPLVELDGKPIGGGTPGPLTRALQSTLESSGSPAPRHKEDTRGSA
jgi:branched-chain amino acid aminotransferase